MGTGKYQEGTAAFAHLLCSRPCRAHRAVSYHFSDAEGVVLQVLLLVALSVVATTRC